MNALDLSFSRLKQLVSIELVLAARGLLAHLQRHASTLVGPCPIHRGDNPRAFVVSLDKGLWHCFTRCRAGGDVVDFVRRLDRIGYADTARYLASLASFGAWTHHHRQDPPRPFRPFSRTLDLDSRAPFLTAKGIRSDTAARFEVGRFTGRGWLERCIAVRLHDSSGVPLGYAGRRLDPQQAAALGKWKLPPRFPKSSILYNFHRARPVLQRGIAIVECPWSVMRLDQIGVPAVALLGIHLADPQKKLLNDASHILLLMDGDQAGREATLRLRSALASHPQVSTADLPDRLDPDDLGDEQLRALCQSLLPLPALF